MEVHPLTPYLALKMMTEALDLARRQAAVKLATMHIRIATQEVSGCDGKVWDAILFTVVFLVCSYYLPRIHQNVNK